MEAAHLHQVTRPVHIQVLLGHQRRWLGLGR